MNLLEKKNDGTFVNLEDVTSFTPNGGDGRWGGFNYSLSLAGLNLTPGNYSLHGRAYDKSGADSNKIEADFTLLDDTQVTLVVSPSSVMEDGSSNLVYTFTRTGVISNALTVNYKVGGSATIGTDYTGISTAGTTKTVTFAANSSTATVTVDPTADTTVENNETVSLTLVSGTGYTIGTASAVTGTITNDDTQVTLVVSPSSVMEDGSSNLVYTFTRTGVISNALTVNYKVGGSATIGTDYTGISTAGTTKTVTFAANSSTATVTVDPTADTTVEENETVILTLAAGSGYTIGTTTAVTGTITNDSNSMEETINKISQPIFTALTKLFNTPQDVPDWFKKFQESKFLGLNGYLSVTVDAEKFQKKGCTTQDSYSFAILKFIGSEVTSKGAMTYLTYVLKAGTLIRLTNPVGWALLVVELGLNYVVGEILDEISDKISDRVCRYDGNDIINGGTGNDYLLGHKGDDIIDGGAGNDSLYGHDGNDIINGGTGDDYLYGHDGNDILDGGTGNDIINGEIGQDTLTGGAGNDVFVFQFGQSGVSGADRISDFAIGSDKIDLLLSLSGAGVSAPAGFTRAANSTASSLANMVNNVFTDANGFLIGNQALGINSAALVGVTTLGIAGTYLVINDGVAGFQSGNDLLVNITGYSGALPSFGTIPVTSFFV
nr:bluetail domain-containing putative surface protein [Cylindrospermopsis raciborskii]